MEQSRSPSVSPSKQPASTSSKTETLFEQYCSGGNPFEIHANHNDEETEDVLASNGVCGVFETYCGTLSEVFLLRSILPFEQGDWLSLLIPSPPAFLPVHSCYATCTGHGFTVCLIDIVLLNDKYCLYVCFVFLLDYFMFLCLLSRSIGSLLNIYMICWIHGCMRQYIICTFFFNFTFGQLRVPFCSISFYGEKVMFYLVI